MKHLRIPYIILLIHVVYSCNTNDNSTSAPPPNSETKSITVMNYNILHAKKENRPGYHWNEPDNRKERLIKLIEKYSPDILTAQEDMYKQGEYIKEKTGLRKIGVSRDAGTTGGTSCSSRRGAAPASASSTRRPAGSRRSRPSSRSTSCSRARWAGCASAPRTGWATSRCTICSSPPVPCSGPAAPRRPCCWGPTGCWPAGRWAAAPP